MLQKQILDIGPPGLRFWQLKERDCNCPIGFQGFAPISNTAVWNLCKMPKPKMAFLWSLIFDLWSLIFEHILHFAFVWPEKPMLYVVCRKVEKGLPLGPTSPLSSISTHKMLKIKNITGRLNLKKWWHTFFWLPEPPLFMMHA